MHGKTVAMPEGRYFTFKPLSDSDFRTPVGGFSDLIPEPARFTECVYERQTLMRGMASLTVFVPAGQDLDETVRLLSGETKQNDAAR